MRFTIAHDGHAKRNGLRTMGNVSTRVTSTAYINKVYLVGVTLSVLRRTCHVLAEVPPLSCCCECFKNGHRLPRVVTSLLCRVDGCRALWAPGRLRCATCCLWFSSARLHQGGLQVSMAVIFFFLCCCCGLWTYAPVPQGLDEVVPQHVDTL